MHVTCSERILPFCDIRCTEPCLAQGTRFVVVLGRSLGKITPQQLFASSSRSAFSGPLAVGPPSHGTLNAVDHARADLSTPPQLPSENDQVAADAEAPPSRLDAPHELRLSLEYPRGFAGVPRYFFQQGDADKQECISSTSGSGKKEFVTTTMLSKRIGTLLEDLARNREAPGKWGCSTCWYGNQRRGVYRTVQRHQVGVKMAYSSHQFRGCFAPPPSAVDENLSSAPAPGSRNIAVPPPLHFHTRTPSYG